MTETANAPSSSTRRKPWIGANSKPMAWNAAAESISWAECHHGRIIRARALVHRTAEMLPAHLVPAFIDALRPGAFMDDGFDVADAIPFDVRGYVVMALYLAGASAESLQGALAASWMSGHIGIIRIAHAYGLDVLKVFRRARFRIPDDLPPTLTVWRGTSGIAIETARRGLSWSTSRDYAAIYALGAATRTYRGSPLLIRREIPRDSILYWWCPLEPYSEVIFDTLPGGDVDGTVADWQAASRRARAAIGAPAVERLL